jgi:hypothetical protein
MTPYQKILRAAERGKGVRLSADDVAHLAQDTAICTVAEHDDVKASLPDDERAHYECFIALEMIHPSRMADCEGDGWYGCAKCGRWEGHYRDCDCPYRNGRGVGTWHLDGCPAKSNKRGDA